jgi:phage baseplate assembly protein W
VSERLEGLAFPFRITNGGMRRSADADKVADDVRHLLSTQLGERPMLRTYGGGVHSRRQEPNDATLRAVVAHEIEQALRAFLPGVRLTSPVLVDAREERLRISVEYAADPRAVARIELDLT